MKSLTGTTIGTPFCQSRMLLLSIRIALALPFGMIERLELHLSVYLVRENVDYLVSDLRDRRDLTLVARESHRVMSSHILLLTYLQKSSYPPYFVDLVYSFGDSASEVRIRRKVMRFLFLLAATIAGLLISAAGYAQAPATPSSTARPSVITRPGTTAHGTPGPGQVWVNTSSKVYHCPSDRYYGKTKRGEYMPETQAKSSGFHAVNNKACTS